MKVLKSHKAFDGLVQFWEHDSVETKTKMKFSTFVPSNIRGSAPKGAVIFLSGLTCTDENFISKAGALSALSQNDLMLICPDTSPRGLNLPHEHESYDFGSGAGFYVDATTPGYGDHYRMYSYVANEIHSILQTDFKIQPDRISIMGHSMGGHGALIMGLREPKKFRSVSAFSPIVNPSVVPWGLKAFAGYLGEDQTLWAQYDASELIRQGAKSESQILITQGLADEFLPTQLKTENFESACREQGLGNDQVAVAYMKDYDHSYYFISSFIDFHIRHHANVQQA